MNTTDQFRPRRQTMMNVKPTDYVPFEDVVRTSLYQQAQYQQAGANIAPSYPASQN